MRMISIMFSLVLIGAIAVPFLLGPPKQTTSADVPASHPDQITELAEPDSPLLDDITSFDPTTFDPTIGGTSAFRWQDEQGNWHFGDEAPDATGVEKIKIVPRHTALEDGWAGAEDETAGGGEKKFSIIDVYTGRAADQARNIHTR